MDKQMGLLIVDDRQDNLLVLSSLVREYFPAIEIHTASNAEAGIRLTINKQIDGAIVDLQMPGMDGIEMCRQLKADPRSRQIALILITAHSADPKLKARGLEAGADDFILRPFDNVEFIARVKVMLRVKKAENDLRAMNQHLEERVADKILELQESEKRLRQLSENSQEWVWESDINGLCTYSNAAISMFGYTPAEFIGQKKFYDLAPPDQREALKKVGLKLFKARKSFRRFVNRNIGKNGEAIWLSTSGVPMLDDKGTLRGYRGRAINITPRKRAENLQNAQLRLINYSASHTIPECLEQFLAEAEGLTDSEIGFYHFVEDDQETITLQAWSKNIHMEMCSQKIVNRHYPISEAGIWVDCVHARQPVIHNDYASLPHKKGLPEGHITIVRELVVPVIRGGKVKAVLGVGNKKSNYTQEDVLTIQKLADVSWETIVAKRSEAERELLKSAVEQAAEAIVITDKAGLIQYVNPAFELITGYSRAETLGQNPRILGSGKTSVPIYQEMWRNLLNGESWRGQFNNKRKDGSLYTEEVAISPVVNTVGETTHYVAVKTDITKSLELEDELRQSQKIQAIGQLAGGIAHDFNNILTIILGCGAMALRHLPSENRCRRDVETMIIAAKKAENLTRQLLAFSRRQVFEVRTVDLNTLIANFIPLLGKLLRENIQLVFSPAVKPVFVQVDPTQAEQILINLIVNARDAIGEGEGVISIKIAQPEISEIKANIHLTETHKEFGLITVEDTGSGIATGIIDKIFDPFFTTKELGQGTGLGLSTVYGIVKQSGGYLFVDSCRGEGSKFSIFLPAGDAHLVQDLTAPATTRNQKISLNILVIDDEELVLSVMEEALSQDGHRVVVSQDPLEALDLWMEQKDELDLVITDVGLPGINGVDLADKFLENRKSTSILFISGYGELHEKKVSSLQRNINFLQKPFTPEELLTKVDAISHENMGTI